MSFLVLILITAVNLFFWRCIFKMFRRSMLSPMERDAEDSYLATKAAMKRNEEEERQKATRFGYAVMLIALVTGLIVTVCNMH